MKVDAKCGRKEWVAKGNMKDKSCSQSERQIQKRGVDEM